MRYALLLAALLLPLSAHAQLCGLEPAPVLRFSPVAPTSAQNIDAIVGTLSFVPTDAVAVVSGNAIDITANGSGKPARQPPHCIAATIGLLPAGTYTVNFYTRLPGEPPLVSLQKTATLVVTQAGRNEPIPALDTISIVLLALLVLVVSARALSRRHDPPG